MSTRPLDEEAVFHAARRIQAPEECAKFISHACRDDGAAAERVQALLEIYEREPDEPAARMGRPTATLDFERIVERPGSRVGPYRLMEQIGEGGFGLVFVAEQQEPVRRKIALKVIKPGMDSRQVIARFEAERQALALMDHPSIARVLDAGTTESGRPYFVMELVRGIPITDYCDQNHLAPRERLELFISVCQAIQHAHQKGIIHRDIKPSNVLVTSHDGKPLAKVIDFGVAKAIHQQLTEKTIYTDFAQMIGTPLYMSPEQAEMSAVDIDTRSDIYSLGVLLYELLTGTTPLERKRFAKAAYDEMRRMIREEEPPRPSQRLSTSDALPSLAASRKTEPARLSKLVRGDLDWITMKALEKDRTRRYETANGLARDIQRHLSDEPVEACPPSVGYKLRKFVRRNRGAALAASVVFAALLGGLVMLYGGVTAARYGLERARDAEKAARSEQEEALKQREIANIERKIALEQRTKAEKARDRTRDVLDAMTSTLTGDSLSTQKEISAEQKKFLTQVLTYYREFAGEKADDEQTRARTARAAIRVGQIEYRLGRTEQAVTAVRLALDGFRTLSTGFPASTSYRQELAGSHNNLGLLLADQGNHAEAEQHYRQALEIRLRLASDFPTTPDYQRILAHSYHNLGFLLTARRKWAEAEPQYRLALAIQEKLATDFPSVPEYRGDLAHCHSNFASLLSYLGNQSEALEHARRALAIHEKLAADYPKAKDYRRHMTDSHNNLAVLLAGLGKQELAEEHMRKALEIQEKFAADFPAMPSYRQDLGLRRHNIGVLLAGQGKLATAEEEHRKALAIREKLVAEFPTVASYRHDLAGTHGNLGVLFKNQGKAVEAEAWFRQAVAVGEKQAADLPSTGEDQRRLAESYCNLGVLHRDNRRAVDSLVWFNKAIAVLAPLHRTAPDDAKAKQLLRNTYVERARIYDSIKQPSDALTDWDRAIELSPVGEQLNHRASRAISRIRAGLVAEATAEVAELTKSVNWKAGRWYDFACVHAVVSGKIPDKKQEHADRAMELLHQAVKVGYKNVAHMKKDADLDPLREREDFKKLLAELEAKVGK